MAKIEAQIAKPTTVSEGFKKLLAFEKQINEQYKTKAIVRLGDKVGIPIPSIATNLPTFDYGVIQTGGFPRGRIVEIFGPESSGKTTICLHTVASEQRYQALQAEPKNIGYVDAEHALDVTYASKLGVNVDDLVVSQPDSGEQALQIVQSMVESDLFSLVIVDSVAALVPEAELNGEMGDSHVGLQARLMSQAMRKLTGITAKHNVTVIFINQIREKVGVMFGSPETTSGGRALKFFASVRIDTRRREAIKEKDVIIGHHINLKAVKNKCGSPFRETLIDLLYDPVHIDVEFDTIQYAVDSGIIERSGSWFKYNGENIGQGLDNTKEYLKNNPKVLEEIRSKIK